MFGIFQHLLLQMRNHYDALAAICLLCLILVAILDYGLDVYGCDLLCWRQQLEQVEDKPMVVMLLVAGLKMLLILLLTLLSYLQVRPEMEPPISHVRRRYCRFIVMRLLAAHDEFLHDNGQIQGRHDALLQAIQLFRSDARKLYERNAAQLRLSIQHMLPVEEQQELELLQRGYDKYKCVSQLRETEIYKMVLAQPLPKH